jgi:hypothetical protein
MLHNGSWSSHDFIVMSTLNLTPLDEFCQKLVTTMAQ